MKSAYYVATVTNAYRQALDMLPNPPTETIKAELFKASHRRYTTGFYYSDEEKQYTADSMPVQESEFVALVDKDCENGEVWLEMRNKFSVGDTLEILSPNKDLLNEKFVIEKITNSQNESVESAKVVQEIVKVPCKLPLKKGDILRR